MARRGVKPPVARMGPKRNDIDWHDVAILCGNYNPPYDIAAIIKVDERTLDSECKKLHGEPFVSWMEKRRANTRNRLRGWQLSAAEKGNITMMIWLGKQLLGQSDKVDQVDKYWTSKRGKEELINMGKQALAVIQAATQTKAEEG